MVEVAKTIVSPDVMTHSTTDESGPKPSVQVGEHAVVLIPMAEWKQCAQRGVRTFIQAAGFMIAGGGLKQLLTGYGIPAADVAGLPSTGTAIYDALLYALVFALIVVLWNFVEFWLDIDINAPKWRA
jgi:hypothetical protein